MGYFDLDIPINDTLVNDLVNPKKPSAESLIKHLVNHTSGLVDEDDMYLESYYILAGENTASASSQLLQDFGIVQRTPKTLSELINSYYYDGGYYYSWDNFDDTNPGEVESYTNVGDSLMAFLIETASGLSYQNFVETHIFNPLNMNNTSFEYSLPNDNYAILYYDENIPLPFYGLESFADGGLKTSNEDLMKYMLNMIAGQRGETNTLFSESYYDLLFTETSATYSVFWDVDPGNNAYGHNGGDPGTTTDFHFSGPGNAGFFLLSNYDASTDEHE